MGSLQPKELRFVASRSSGEVSALWQRPADADAALVLAHGAGAGMRHAFMEAITQRLATCRIATLTSRTSRPRISLDSGAGFFRLMIANQLFERLA